MSCPHNEECSIEFYSETNDSGDSSTPYFSSWTVWIYDPEDSEHVPNCPGLSEEEIKKLEEERNSEPDYDDFGMDP